MPAYGKGQFRYLYRAFIYVLTLKKPANAHFYVKMARLGMHFKQF